MDVGTFRTVLPAFADPGQYSGSAITYWLGVGMARFNPLVWGTNLNEGLLYFIAHNLALVALGSKSGGLNGSGIVSSKSVGPASISYDNNIGMIDGAGPYNLTIYGRQFYQLSQMVGAGGLQVSPGAYSGGDRIGIPVGSGIII